MFEIELKAHVKDRKAVESRLKVFASYINTVEKYDVYWKRDRVGADGLPIKVRIREERDITTGTTKVYVTYKKKELRKNADGVSFEVNNENEFLVSDRQPFETFIKDSGFSIEIYKHKSVQEWKYENALLELCLVEGLGDFIEIEILTDNQDEKNVTETRNKLEVLLEKCGVPKSEIESRYYSEMLKSVSQAL